MNAVAFVVCSDVEHATQVADLLRTPEYLGRESPVLAVVSVNKLKEG